MGGLRGKVALAAAVTAIALAMVVARVVWSSRVEWRDAEARFATGDVSGAVDRWGRAARLYAPGNPFASRALARLAALARGDQAGTDEARARALVAWREVRSAILGTRGLYTPHRALLVEANGRIAALTAALESPAIDPGADETARARWHAERLARDDAPSVGWSLLALLGLFGWIGAAVGFFFHGLDERERLRGRVALLFAAGVAAGFALFLVALSRA